MKLLETFKRIVNEVEPELCWFTTFNLNLQLLEKYILTAIVGKDPAELKRAEDYEALNLELNRLNIKVWYDYRALDFKHGKRTTVDLYPVKPSSILGSNTDEPIFHPKIIFVKGKRSAYLMTGSFNLSLAGWSCNREAVLVKEINCRENASQVIDFFKNLNAGIADIRKLESWANQLPNVKSSWKFAHNFNTNNILEEIKGNSLVVWSPYFSKSTSDLITAVKKIGYREIKLVPDISQSQKVRITPQELHRLQNDSSIKIFSDANIDREKQSLFHAKVWLSDNKIAVGSWNCSFRAIGISVPKEERNIEAGIIEAILPAQRNILSQSLNATGITEITGTEEEEIDREWCESLNPYTMSCDITANWETFKYELDFSDSIKEFKVELPHDSSKRFPMSEINGLTFIDGYNRLLKNREFTIYDSNEEVAFVGYLNDLGKIKRPTEGYVSFYDLFVSLNINPLDCTPKARVKYKLDEEEEGGLENEAVPFFIYSGHESYYMMFVAFQKLLDTINENKFNSSKLEDLGYRLPGSLINILGLFETSLKCALQDGKEDEILFHYFMAREVNECILAFNNYFDRKLKKTLMHPMEEKLQLTRKDHKFLIKATAIT